MTRPNDRKRRRGNRRGVAIVIVLSMITITLAISYSLMRTQSMVVQIQHNSNRRILARQTALAGMSAALRHLRLQAWIDAGGVASTYSGRAGAQETYEVTFATGDPSLSEGDADYADYPYRVTLLSTGRSVDPSNTNIVATHQIRAVVRLIPQQLAAEPNPWGAMQQYDADTPYTVYQWSSHSAVIEVPVRVEGPMHLQGKVQLCEDYPFNVRPFHGTIDEVAIYDEDLSVGDVNGLYTHSLHWNSELVNWYLYKTPIAWWRLNEAAGATVATDVMGNHHGTYVGPKSGVSGVPNGDPKTAASFDGGNDYVDLGAIDISGEKMTIVAWFKVDSFDYGTEGRILSKATGTDEQQHHWMLSTVQVGSSVRLRCRIRKGGSTTTLTAGSGHVTTGQWVCAAVVVDETAIELYHNGIKVAEVAKSGTLDTDPAASVFLGDNPPGSSRARLLRDLTAMWHADLGDYRPMTGPVYLPLARTPIATRSLMQDELELTLLDVPATSGTPIAHPGQITTYQIYSGGKSYDVGVLGANLGDLELKTDPKTNPLGIRRRAGGMDVWDDVTIQGTLLTHGSNPDVYVRGENVHFLPVSMPSLEGETLATQLPVAMVKDDFHVHPAATGTLEGMVIAWDKFKFHNGTVATEFTTTGRVLAARLQFEGRTQWDQSRTLWETYLENFLAQLPAISYFPKWLKTTLALDPEPQLVIRPTSSAVRYHFPQDWSQPIYVPKTNNAGLGLKWDLLEWTDSP